MCGLAVVRTARLNMVVGADRNIQRLLEIPIEIADQNAIGAIWIRKPSLERARKAGARIMRWLHWQLLAPGLSARCEQQRKRRACQYSRSSLHHKSSQQKNKGGIALCGQPLPRLRDYCYGVEDPLSKSFASLTMPLLVLRSPFLVVIVAHVGHIHPSMRHLIDGPVSVANPLVRIRIVAIFVRVV